MILEKICKSIDKILVYDYDQLQDETIVSVSKIFSKADRDFFIVLKDKKPFYIFTSTDIIDALIAHDDEMKIVHFMEKHHKSLLSFNKKESIFNVYKTTRTYKIHHIVVTDDEGKFISVVTYIDLASFLSEIAIKDELTGLYNKRFFDFIIDKYNNDAIQTGVLFIDLDNFKIINDTLGHLKGDLIIKECAKNIKKNIRDIDYAFRFGGDEFVVLLFADKEVTQKVASRIQNDIDTLVMFSHKISASVGFAHYPSDGKSLELIMEKADKNMYKNKNKKKLKQLSCN